MSPLRARRSSPARLPGAPTSFGWGHAVIAIAIYICADDECGATWRILPVFLARHLWRTWRTVERTVMPGGSAATAAPPIPARTRARWLARLASAARALIVLFALSGGPELVRLATDTDDNATRLDLVGAYSLAFDVGAGARLAAIAALSHRLERGIRLM